MKDTLLGTKSC